MLRKTNPKNGLILATLLASLLNSCATNQPTTFFTSETQRKVAESFRSNDENELQLRFGQLSRVVNHDWIKTWKSGDARALKFSWVVPGVTMLMKEVWWTNTGSPEFRDHVLEWNPYTNRITWISLAETNTNFPNFNSIENYSTHTRSHGNYDATKGIPYLGFDENTAELNFAGTLYRRDNSNLTNSKLKLVQSKELITDHKTENSQTSATQNLRPSTIKEQRLADSATSERSANQSKETQIEPEIKAEDFAKHYPILKTNETKVGLLKKDSKTKEVKPAIYLFNAKIGQKLEINISSSKFSPSIAVYQFDSDQLVGTKSGASPLSNEFYFSDKGIYLVIVTSLDKTKGGEFKVKTKEVSSE